jgi:serine/threonine protein kinase/Tfp pilus assembly protein PilF
MTIAEAKQFGPYRLIEKIGSGGMGEVYRALDTRLEREVALKLISDNYLGVGTGSGTPSPVTPTPQGSPSSGVSHERFLREARSAATLNHPNVCSIHDTGEQDGRPYLVMELLRGETLKQYLARSGGKGLSREEVILFSQQAAAALAAAHRKGIIHRDIKPANIFVVEGERGKHLIKILDFGLAKKQADAAASQSQTFGPPGSSSDETSAGPGTATLELTSPGSAVGTVAYMSPEQAKGDPLDARTDLFSLGSVIYEMATGKAAFSGGSAAELFVALLTLTPPPISSVSPTMPKKLDAIVAKLLAKDPGQRFANADALQVALEDLDPHASAAIDSGRRKWPWAMAAVLLLLVAGGLAWWKLRPAPASTPGAGGAATDAAAPEGMKSSIILADFVNQTGDPVFDTTLNKALEIDLGQSPVIAIVSPQHLAQSVKYLGKPADTAVTPAIAREIGIREGIKAILTGTIANLGKEYVITLTAVNTATGDEIVNEQAQAPDKEHVLDALSKAAAAMRGKLGEDLASIKKLDTPFGQATTTSLEAFRAYALGEKAHERSHDIPEAEGHYLRAIELDPKFAMAYARLGVVYGNSGQFAKSDRYHSKAYALAKDVSERERLYIAGHYELNVTGDVPKSIETLQEAIQAYPNQEDNYVNINVDYQVMGQYEQALPYAQKGVEVDPQDAIGAENLLQDYLALGRMAEVKTQLERDERLGLNTSTEELAIQRAAYFLLGDEHKMQELQAKWAGRPDEFVATQILGFQQMYSGQYRLASATMQQGFVQAARAKAPDAQAGILLNEVIGAGMGGNCTGSEAAVRQALALDKSRQTQGAAVLAAAVCENARLSLSLGEELSRKFPEDTLVQEVYVPLSKAFVALAAGHDQEAIAAAEPAKPNDANFPASYLQGLAYLELHDGARAVNAFEAAKRARSGAAMNTFFPPFWAQVQLGLARAYAMAGNKVEARKAYDAFFAIWKNADADLPMLVAAKKEYAAL